MKYSIITLLSAAVTVFADVSHLKQNPDRHYLPPERSVHVSHDQHGGQYHYEVSKPKAINAPKSVIAPHKGLHTSVTELPSRPRKLFTPVGELSEAQASDHVLYATAPNSVFQTQINVQSQGSEFKVPIKMDSETIYDDPERNRRIGGGGINVRSGAGDRSYNRQERTYKEENTTPRSYNDYHNKRTYHETDHTHGLSGSHGRSYDHITRTDHTTKRPSYQGLNLINGNIAGDQLGHLPNLPHNLNGNTQGINLLNSNLLGKSHDQSPQFGYKPKEYDHDHDHHENLRTNKHKAEEAHYKKHSSTTGHHEYGHDDHSKPRQYDHHKEYDYHKIHDNQYYEHASKHNHRKYTEHDQYEKKQHENEYEKHYKEHDHHDHEQRQHNDHHDHREHHDHHENREHHDNHYNREYHDHHDRREHHDNHEKSQHLNRQYDHVHDRTYKIPHNRDIDHQREHHSSDLHESPSKYQNTITSKPAIKIVAYNNNNQSNFQVSTAQAQLPLLNDGTLEEYDPSASAPEVIYKPGDEIDFAETKLVDYQDHLRPLDSYNYVHRRRPKQKNQQQQHNTHGETDLRTDGYHYGKPKVSFDF